MWFWFATTLIVAGSLPALAAQANDQPVMAPAPWQDIEVRLTPNFLLPWVSSRVRPADTRIPSASATVEPGTLISHLTRVPFMGAAELRDGTIDFHGGFRSLGYSFGGRADFHEHLYGPIMSETLRCKRHLRAENARFQVGKLSTI
jgi:hypothetical protein